MEQVVFRPPDDLGMPPQIQFPRVSGSSSSDVHSWVSRVTAERRAEVEARPPSPTPTEVGRVAAPRRLAPAMAGVIQPPPGAEQVAARLLVEHVSISQTPSVADTTEPPNAPSEISSDVSRVRPLPAIDEVLQLGLPTVHDLLLPHEQNLLSPCGCRT